MENTIESAIAALLRKQQHLEAFKEILASYGPELRGFLCGTLGSEADGEDVYQEVCTALWQGLPRFERRSSVRTWAYAVAHHRVAKKVRRRSRRRMVRLDTVQRDGLPSPTRTSIVEHERRRQAVALAFEHLSSAEREILILRTERRLGFTEIAGILGVPEASCRKRFQRAKDHIKGLLQEREEGAP